MSFVHVFKSKKKKKTSIADSLNLMNILIHLISHHLIKMQQINFVISKFFSENLQILTCSFLISKTNLLSYVCKIKEEEIREIRENP